MSLIRKEDLIAEYDRVHQGPPGGARKLMIDAPEIDAVEIVRCENCKHSVPMREFEQRNEEPYKYFRNDIFLCFHEFVGDYPICFEGDFFCKYGERK